MGMMATCLEELAGKQINLQIQWSITKRSHRVNGGCCGSTWGGSKPSLGREWLPDREMLRLSSEIQSVISPAEG